MNLFIGLGSHVNHLYFEGTSMRSLHGRNLMLMRRESLDAEL